MKKVLSALCIFCIIFTVSCDQPTNNINSDASNSEQQQSPSYSSTEDLTDSTLTRTETSTLDKSITIDNYPKMSFTDDTLYLGQRLFGYLFKSDDGSSVGSHSLYPRDICLDEDILKKLDDKSADIVFVSMQSGKESFDDKYEYILIGREAPLLLSADSNPVSTLTSSQVNEIFSAQNAPLWSAYGGESESIARLGRFSSYDAMGFTVLKNGLLSGSQCIDSDFTQESYNALFAMDDGTILAPEDRQHAASLKQGDSHILDVAPFSNFILTASIDSSRLSNVNPIWIDSNIYTPEMFNSGECAGTVNTYAVVPKGTAQGSNARKIISWLNSDGEADVEKIASGIGTLALDEDHYLHAKETVFDAK